MPRKDNAKMRRQWQRTLRAERQFAALLKKVARNCGRIARGNFDADNPIGSSARLRAELERYGQLLTPWARQVAKKMVLDVSRRDEQFWKDKSKEMSRNLREEIARAPTGIAMRERSAEAAAYITSLPLEAAERVEKLAIEYLTRGIRASELAKRIMATGEVTKSRAMLIARTETSRTAALLQEVRAESVGSVGYIWRTVGDIDVRHRHQQLEGKFFRWTNPPIAGENGERAHPGCIYNCRCWAEIVLPGERQQNRNRSRFMAEAA